MSIKVSISTFSLTETILILWNFLFMPRVILLRFIQKLIRMAPLMTLKDESVQSFVLPEL
jgi:hypothetical protein